MLNIYDIYEDILLEAKSKDIRSIIEFAIENNTSIRILYQGEDEVRAGWRLIEPYVLGYRKDTNNIILRALQVTRTASLTPNGNGKDPLTALPNGWRTFRLDRIKDTKPGTGKFRPMKRSEFNMNDKDMTKIIVGVLKSNKTTGDLYFKN
jgi:predicted DNA-binding transcriptional regulator YafY